MQLFDPFKVNLPESIIQPVDTNWDLCVLCQKSPQKSGNMPLTYPNRHKATGSGYEKLEFWIHEFQKLDALPHNINISRIDDGSGISKTLQKNNAGWHRKCYLSYCNDKLKRAQMKANKRKSENVGADCASPVKTRKSIGPLPSSNKNVCFFFVKNLKEKRTGSLELQLILLI